MGCAIACRRPNGGMIWHGETTSAHSDWTDTISGLVIGQAIVSSHALCVPEERPHLGAAFQVETKPVERHHEPNQEVAIAQR